MRAVEKDASHAGNVWPEYAGILNDKIDKLKRVPTQRKLTPSQQGSKSSAPGKSNRNCKPAAGRAKRSASTAKASYGAKKAPAKSVRRPDADAEGTGRGGANMMVQLKCKQP